MTKTTTVSALFLGALLCSGSAFAQTASMQQRLQRLESEVSTLGGPVEVAQVPPGVAQDFEVRLQKLERAVADLTGRYEETTYQVSQLRDRLEKINSDVDFRLKELETKGGGGGATDAFGDAKGTAPAPAAPAAKSADKAPDKPAEKTTQSAAAAPLPANASVEKQYEYAFNFLRESDYDKAEKAFQDFIAKHKTDPLAGNAQYWLGETYYVRGKYQEAAVAFAEGVQKYPKNSKAGDNLLKLGMSLGQMNKKKEACTAFSQLVAKFPDASASVKRRANTESRRLNCPG